MCLSGAVGVGVGVIWDTGLETEQAGVLTQTKEWGHELEGVRQSAPTAPSPASCPAPALPQLRPHSVPAHPGPSQHPPVQLLNKVGPVPAPVPGPAPDPAPDSSPAPTLAPASDPSQVPCPVPLFCPPHTYPPPSLRPQLLSYKSRGLVCFGSLSAACSNDLWSLWSPR